MQIHGVKDEVVPYAGNSGMKAIEDVIDYWSQNNRCDDTPDTEVIPDLNQDGSGGMKTSFMNCQNEVEVTLYLLDSMEHEWPLGDKHDLDAPSTIWQFLSKPVVLIWYNALLVYPWRLNKRDLLIVELE